jgi:FkbM family methyltransferase
MAINMLDALKQIGRRVLGREPWHFVQVHVAHRGLGSSYGQWTVCLAGLSSQSIVYSFGAGEDISFDLALIDMFGLTVYAFDPTPQSVYWVRKQQLPASFHLVEYGLADRDGLAKFYAPSNPNFVSHTMLEVEGAGEYVEVPVRRLVTLATMLNHTDIDVLKLDIEGAEYTALPDILSSNLSIRQILVEFHHRFANVKVKDTNQAVRLLNRHGYRIFHISQRGDEYAFIRG